uniref:PDZ domain-containing protein n=1 Tax=Periophthalmus magnuspinnatus TaxID=409849 RepID=A0A3B4APE8_9GOBI
RHWAPPKGFWRIARPETLLLSGVTPSTLPIMDYTKIDEKCKEPAKTDSKCENVGVAVDDADAPGGIKHSDSMECYLEKSLLVISDELPLSPRHEQAKRLLERARLKARSNHMKGDGVSRRVEPDQSDVYGCSPTRVRFEDESEKEAQSRYLDRVRQRGRSKSRENNQDASSGKNQRSVSVPPALVSVETQTVVREIIVVVKKCEACGSIARETQAVTSPSEPQNTDLQQLTSSEDPRTKQASKPVNTRPKAPLTVTFAGAYVLGEDKEVSSGWKSSGFGKLRRRSRKGESRIESGHGPYGPSWAQRRNSNPRNRVNMPRGVTFAPGSPIALEPRLLEASGGTKELTGPPLPIKSALKSSSRNRVSPNQSVVQFQAGSSAGVEGDIEHDQSEVRRESSPVSLNQSAASTNSPVSCIRPSTLRYSPARMTSDLPDADLWDSRPILRNMALSRSDDLRADLLRAEHLKAEAMWEDSPDGSDGRPKLFLRRFFSSIGLNSVGRLVKGSRSSSMEQLSLPPAPRASSASPSPTRRPQPTIRIQRTPSLQTLHTVFPLAQLRKASSVQSLERRTERSTILGEVQIPYGLAPAFADGTLLLELTKPPNGPFGFVISRGKGRPDTVYVEKVGDGSGEGLYVGLLGVGDEILQVNGEAVAGLALDQVTRLMTRDSTASLRI